MPKWPKDNQAALTAFYGDPGARGFGANLVKVVPPFAMYYGAKRVPYLSFHKLAAPALLRALNHIWAYYGKDQHKLDANGVSVFSGTYNPRKVRGSDTKWSNHAYGAAIDLDAAHNAFNTGHGHIPLVVVAAFKAEGFSWGGDYQHRTDPMHFEACDRGEPARTFERWLAYYKCPPMVAVNPVGLLAPEADAPAALDGADRAGLADDEPALDGEVIHETPKDAPKTGITEGAQAAGGFSLIGAAYEAWDKLSAAPESIVDALVAAAQKPTFWIFAAIGCAALYIWWQRHAVKKGV